LSNKTPPEQSGGVFVWHKAAILDAIAPVPPYLWAAVCLADQKLEPTSMPVIRTSIADIEAIIRSGLDSQLPSLGQRGVRAQLAKDEDGAPILLVDVVVGPDTTDTQALLSAVRKIRPLLLAQDIEEFPVFSFVSLDDAQEIGLGTSTSH
jgi:hypothetical protein